MPIITAEATGEASYTNTTVSFSVNLNGDPGEDLTLGDIDIYAGGGFGFNSRLSLVPQVNLQRLSRTRYIVTFPSEYLDERLHVGIHFWEEINGVWVKSESRAWSTPITYIAPAELTILVDKTLIRNSETIDVQFVFDRNPVGFSASNVSVSAGTLSNFRGSGRVYRAELTAPTSGIGFIALEVTGVQSPDIEGNPQAIVGEYLETFTYAPEPTGDVFFLGAVTSHHLNRQENTHFIREITADDLDTINDFGVILPFSENVSLSEDAIELLAVDSEDGETDISLQSFSGEKSVYEIVVRPPVGGGSGTIFITIPENAVPEGNPEKQFEMFYTDAVFIPEWETLFQTAETYKDIVSVSYDGIQLLRDDQIDFFDFEGTLSIDKQVSLPDSASLMRAVKYDVDKYIGLSDATDTTAHLVVAGAESWASHGVWKLGTYNASDWAWTRDRRVIIVATPPAGPDLSVLSSLEVHEAIRNNYDLNDVVFDDFSINDGAIESFDTWGGMVSIAHEDNKLFIASNESSEQNYIFIYDAKNNLIPGQRIPIEGRVKSLFVSKGYLYRYDDTTKTLSRYPLDALRSPEPRARIYPIQALPGDSIDLRRLANFADSFVFDTGFDKPEWLTIEENFFLKVDPAAIPKSTAYVRLRAISRVGASQLSEFGFYIYVRLHRTPQWKDFESLSMYPDQVLNMLEFVDDADFLEWTEGFTPPSEVELDDNGKITLT